MNVKGTSTLHSIDAVCACITLANPNNNLRRNRCISSSYSGFKYENIE